MIKTGKAFILTLFMISCTLFAENRVTIPVLEDIAFGTEPLLKYVSSVNNGSFDTLFICNFTC